MSWDMPSLRGKFGGKTSQPFGQKFADLKINSWLVIKRTSCCGYLATGLQGSQADRTYVPNPAIEKVGGCIDAVEKAIMMHKQGLFGKKLIMTL